MPLLDTQRLLARMVGGGSSNWSVVSENQLRADEVVWLKAVEQSPGLKVTQDTAKWWRKTRLQLTAPFTLKLLSRLQLEYVLENYFADAPCKSLFFEAELESFCQYLHSSLPNENLVKSLIRFERDLRKAHRSQKTEKDLMPSIDHDNSNSTSVLRDRSQSAEFVSMLHFNVNLTSLLAALLQNLPLPVVKEDACWVTVSSKLPTLWRESLL